MSRLRKGIVGAVFGLLLGAASIGMAEAATYYVSPNCTAAADARDGTSWATAWKDMDEIQWGRVQANDRIELDAGATYGAPVIYRKPLVMQTGSGHITISVSHDMNRRNGYVLISVPPGTPAAVDFQAAKYMTLEGENWQQLRVEGGIDGVYIQRLCEGAVLRNVTVQRAERAAVHTEANAFLRQVVIKDSPIDALVDLMNGFGHAPTFYRCWIHNRDLVSGQGVLIQKGDTYPLTPDYSSPSFEDTIFGPGLSTAITVTRPQTNVHVIGSLFLNSQQHNFQKLTDETTSFKVSYCTSFMTPLNAAGKVHSAITLPAQQQDTVQNCIVWGGAVQVPATARKQVYNDQFRTTGNTLYLSGRQINPQFAANVAIIPNNVKNSDLTDRTGAYYRYANFALLKTSPYAAARWGANVKSVGHLLGSNLAY